MSSGGPADDAEDPARARSGESFDTREQVKSGAAYELHCRATADSAVYDHPGFVPDAYLDGLGVSAYEFPDSPGYEPGGRGRFEIERGQ